MDKIKPAIIIVNCGFISAGNQSQTVDLTESQ